MSACGGNIDVAQTDPLFDTFSGNIDGEEDDGICHGYIQRNDGLYYLRTTINCTPRGFGVKKVQQNRVWTLVVPS